MKIHPQEEKNDARKKLPLPLVEFLGSRALTNLYLGIQKKLKINVRQLMIVSEITNTTLLGLESQSAFEANLHQLLPELSNEATRELTADVNDRIFKEARRRVTENISDPDSFVPTDAPELSPEEHERLTKERFEIERYDTPEEAQKRKDDEAKRIAEEALRPPVIEEPIEYDEVEEKPAESSIEGLRKTIDSEKTSSIPIRGVPMQNLIEKKLGAPETATPERVSLAQSPVTGIQRLEVGSAPSVPLPAQTLKPVVPAPRLKGDSDPYREAPE